MINMVTIKDGCGCDPCDCDWKQKLKEAYSRAIQSVNKIGDNDGSVYFPDGTGFVKLPLPRQSDVAQIKTNAQDIADLKIRDTQLQADINAETTAREEAITAEASAREAGITAEASTREAKDTELDADITRIDNTDTAQDQRIQDNTDKITSTYNDLVSTEATVATHNTQIINLQSQTQALSKSLVSDVMMTDGTTTGSVQVSIEKVDGTVVTSANYKWGRDIGVRLEAGTHAGYIKTVISLSDGTVLESNEYKIVEVLESDVYVTAITLVPDMAAGTIGGNISYSNGTTQTINTINVPTAPGVTSAIEALQSRMTAVEQKNTAQDSQISALDARVQAIENTPGISQFASGKLGTIAGSTADGRVKAEDDGTGSVNGWSELKQRVTTAEGQITTAQNDISAIETKNTQQDTAINGKVSIAQGTANAGKVLGINSSGNVEPIAPSGDEWEEINLNNWPHDWIAGDVIKISAYEFSVTSTTNDWASTPILNDSSWSTDTGYMLSFVEIAIPNTSSTTGYSYGVCDLNPNKSSYIVTRLIKVYGPSRLNDSGLSHIGLVYAAFNGDGRMASTKEITDDILTNHIYKIYRRKR